MYPTWPLEHGAITKIIFGALLGKTTSNSTWKFNPKMLSKMEAREHWLEANTHKTQNP
jgi:hypothetical protein